MMKSIKTRLINLFTGADPSSPPSDRELHWTKKHDGDDVTIAQIADRYFDAMQNGIELYPSPLEESMSDNPDAQHFHLLDLIGYGKACGRRAEQREVSGDSATD